MAIDSAQKRFSMQGLALPWRGVKVVPTGTVDAAERAAFIFLYSGIALTSITITDNRTAGGRLVMAFDSGDAFRLRLVRTDGASNLQTIDEGSAMTGVVTQN